VPPREQEQVSHPWAAVLQPSKKNQIMLVNKCNKTNVNITKDIDQKFIPFHKMCEASDGPKISLQNKSQGIKIHSLTPQLF
jgi:hypothetical protein